MINLIKDIKELQKLDTVMAGYKLEGAKAVLKALTIQYDLKGYEGVSEVIIPIQKPEWDFIVDFANSKTQAPKKSQHKGIFKRESLKHLFG